MALYVMVSFWFCLVILMCMYGLYWSPYGKHVRLYSSYILSL